MGTGEQHSALGRIGRYQLLEPIGSGGMGAVYLARLSGELGFEKLLALKVLLPEVSRDRRFIEMFLDEARIAARLSHPNVCEIFELGSDDGRHFIAMQYLRGIPLSEVLRTPPDDHISRIRLIASAVAQAAEGLHHAHQLVDDQGAPMAIVHRDVSPPNLFVTVDGMVKVLDFGIAKARDIDAKTRAEDAIKGKLAYMSPEQVADKEIDRQSDVFSLGIVLYEGITATRLFARKSDALVAQAILQDPIEDPRKRRPEVSAELAAVALRALARNKRQRFASARELGEALAKALGPSGPMSPVEISESIATRFSASLGRDAARVERATSTTFRHTGSGTVATKRRKTGRLLPIMLLVLVGAGGAFLAKRFLLTTDDAATGDSASELGKTVAASATSPDAAAQQTATILADAAVAVDQLDAGLADAAPDAATKRTGTISIDSTPYATIYVDGRRVGVTPLINHRVKAGKRRIRAVAATGKTKRFRITVRPGKRAPAKILTW